MLFAGEIFIPKGRALNNPIISPIKISKGLLHKIDVFFPPGNRCRAFVTFNQATHQLLPTNPDGYLKGDALTISGEVFLYLPEPPFVIDVHGFSPDAVFNHTVYYCLWMKLPWQMSPFSDELYDLILQDTMPSVPE